MEISDIVEDSLKYPISDFKKFLILGIPYLIIGLFALLFLYEAAGLSTLSDVSQEALLSSPLFSTFMVTFLLFIVVVIVCTIIMSGIGLSVIKETIKPSNMLPNIEFKTNILDGIKSLIVSLVYIIIPSFIFIILMAIVGAALGEDSGVIILILMLIFLIAMIIIGLLLTVAICRLAETNSIGEALNVGNIIEIGKKIGFVKIFATLLICNVILGIISLVGSLVNMIPVIGTILVIYLLYTYIMLVTYRAYGLLYREKYGNMYAQNAFQPPYNQIENNPAPKINNEMNDYKAIDTDNENIDFQNMDTQYDNQTNESSEPIMIKCSKCGYSNPDYVKICVNCGNEL